MVMTARRIMHRKRSSRLRLVRWMVRTRRSLGCGRRSSSCRDSSSSTIATIQLGEMCSRSANACCDRPSSKAPENNSAMNDLSRSTGVAIRVEALSKRFGSVQALDRVDLEVPAATIFGLLGPNGAGKTTTIRVLSTILPPDGGRAEVLGHDVVREAKAVRERIGLAGQYAAVDGNLTGRENLRLIGRLVHLPRRVIAERAAELLERFELTDAADRPVRTYSGGMRRRIDLAAALMNRPPVLFLDEPTTGLDPYSRNEVWRMVGELVADGTTVVLTTQYLEEADRLPPRAAGARGGTGSPEIDGTTVRLTTHDGSRLVVDALRALDAEGIVPATLVVREPSLDDVFLALTGRHAEPAEAEA